MNRSFKPLIINLGIAIMAALGACNKDAASLSTNTTTAIQAAVAQTQSLAVATSTTTTGDSVYIVNICAARSKRDSVSQANLLTSITTYLSANYSGYSFQKAFKISDTTGTVQGYVVVIQYNGNPVGLTFDAAGAFVKVLEQREGLDLLGKGFHEGGCFQHRDGKQRDTISISSLPAAITTYFTTNYATDTLVRASKTNDGSYVLLSKNGSLFATAFNAAGTFINRIQLPAEKGKATVMEQSALPAVVAAYLTATYPGYVFNKAFVITVNGTVQGYCVVIDANSTKYGLAFDAAGKFVAQKILR